MQNLKVGRKFSGFCKSKVIFCALLGFKNHGWLGWRRLLQVLTISPTYVSHCSKLALNMVAAALALTQLFALVH
jgi:hypothetical protein